MKAFLLPALTAAGLVTSAAAAVDPITATDRESVPHHRSSAQSTEADLVEVAGDDPVQMFFRLMTPGDARLFSSDDDSDGGYRGRRYDDDDDSRDRGDDDDGGRRGGGDDDNDDDDDDNGRDDDD
jgi:hypothetical protein